MAASVATEKCTGCGDCVESCPLSAIEVKENIATVDADACGDCGACVDACPSQAISVD